MSTLRISYKVVFNFPFYIKFIQENMKPSRIRPLYDLGILVKNIHKKKNIPEMIFFSIILLNKM